MPKGNHYGRARTRSYTSEYQRIFAKTFKSLLNKPLGDYFINSDSLSNEHRKLTLTTLNNDIRVITFTIKNKRHQIALKLDSRSASNKLYITCPYCHKQRQHLYAVKSAYVCRECLGLHYASQSERSQDRLMRRIRKLRKELWGADYPEVNSMFQNIYYWPKPKKLHWKTFERKRNNIIELEKVFWPISLAQMRITFGEQFMKKD